MRRSTSCSSTPLSPPPVLPLPSKRTSCRWSRGGTDIPPEERTPPLDGLGRPSGLWNRKSEGCGEVMVEGGKAGMSEGEMGWVFLFFSGLGWSDWFCDDTCSSCGKQEWYARRDPPPALVQLHPSLQGHSAPSPAILQSRRLTLACSRCYTLAASSETWTKSKNLRNIPPALVRIKPIALNQHL
jgi:hypothetical protein